MKFLKCLKNFVSLVLLVSLLSCTSLPDYARPQLHIPPEGTSISQHGFSYRKLAFSDFQATSLPVDIQQFSRHLSARSCISLRPTQQSKVNISRSFFYSYPTYAGNFEHISFEAFFIPSCSWLNDKVKDGLKAYVLQHEQIHFALAELTAHKVTHTAKEGLGQYIVFGNTNNEIKTKLMAKARELAQSVINSELKIQTAFDEDTSGVYAPKIQQQWWEDVEKRLAEDRKLSGELQ